MEQVQIEFARKGDTTIWINALAPREMTKAQIAYWADQHRDAILRMAAQMQNRRPCLLIIPASNQHV